MFRIAMAAALAVSLATVPASATSDPSYELISTIEAVGVPVYGGAPICEQGIYGVYDATKNRMLLCVDGAAPQDFTPRQRQTLRHEAVHLMQDCHAGLDNRDMGLLVTDERLGELIEQSGINPVAIERTYKERLGASDAVVRIELEAWAMQDLKSEQQLAEGIERLCEAS